MIQAVKNEPIEPEQRLLAIRHAFLDRLWGGMVVISLIGVPISVWRAAQTGWQPVYGMHIGLGVLAVTLYFARNSIGYRAKLFFQVGLFAAVGLSGIFTLGLLGAGVWFLVMCSLLASTFFSMRAGIAVAIINFLLLAFAAVLFTQGILRVPFDANTYATSVTGWATLMVAASVMPYVVFTGFGIYQRTIVDLLHEVKQQRDRIAELAALDSLTGLPTSSLTHDRLQMKLHAARRHRSLVAVMFIDLNGFKPVNDTFGHEAGDHLLQAVAQRLKGGVREDDTVGRVGGDEFMVVMGDIQGRHEVVPIAEKLLFSLSQSLDYAGQSIYPGASIGIAMYPDDGEDVATLRRQADRAMYQVKRSGRSGYLFADAAVSEMPLAN